MKLLLLACYSQFSGWVEERGGGGGGGGLNFPSQDVKTPLAVLW